MAITKQKTRRGGPPICKCDTPCQLKLTYPSPVPDIFHRSFLLAQVIGECQVDEIANLFGNVIFCVEDNSPRAVKIQRCTYFLFELLHHVALAVNKYAVDPLLGADAIYPDCRPALCFTGKVAGGVPFKSLFEGADSGGFRRYVEYEFPQHKEPFSDSGGSFFKYGRYFFRLKSVFHWFFIHTPIFQSPSDNGMSGENGGYRSNMPSSPFVICSSI
jgi:hypothetical protein